MVEATAAVSVKAANGSGGAAVDFVMCAVDVRDVFPAVSAVVRVTCSATAPDAGEEESVRDEVAGTLAEAMAGRLVNVRCCVNGAAGSESECFAGSIGLMM